MKSSFFCKIEVSLSEPNFSNASIPLGQIAKKIAEKARRNIRHQTDIRGAAFRPLSVKTIKDKIKQGSEFPRRALYRKGVMYRAIHIYKLSKNAFAVGIIPRGTPRRDMIAMIHQKLGPVIRSFLGFDSQTKKWARTRISRWIAERKQKGKKRSYSLNY